MSSTHERERHSKWWLELFLIFSTPLVAWITLVFYGDYTTLGLVLLVCAGIGLAECRNPRLHFRHWTAAGWTLALLWIICNPLHTLYVTL